MKHIYMTFIELSLLFLFVGCISNEDSSIEGGTPDITQCSPIDGVLDGVDFIPKSAIIQHEADGRTHPDIFYIAWAQLDARTSLRRPEKGYNNSGFEDKLLVSRKQRDGSYKSWQIYPALDNECQDVEKVRIQSFDVAPDGKSLYLAMSKSVFDANDTLKANDLNPSRNLGIFKMDIATKKITPITHDYSVGYSYPTYIGDNNITGSETLLVSKTVTVDEIPLHYKSDVMLDEYDRVPVPLLHTLDVTSGATVRIGFNNSHQTEPVVIKRDSPVPLVVFTQWEHQGEFVNRFSLWKMQIDGSDNFTFYGQESESDGGGKNKYEAREILSGKYKGYILMGQSKNSNTEGDIIMTKRENLDLRSKKIILSEQINDNGVTRHYARTPEHYNSESFVYAYRADIDSSYKIMIKDYPEDLNATVDALAGEEVIVSNYYHFVQPRSFYPPTKQQVAPGEGDLSQNRTSFTNNYLNGKSGYLVDNLSASDNGAQHQINGIDTNDIRMRFFIPSHTFTRSQTLGLAEKHPETTIPSSDFIALESDGSLGVILKNGLYVWKIHKRFKMTDGAGEEGDIWIPIRAERQEVNFVPNRVNACNQCHQERSQENIDKYENYESIAQKKMKGNLADVIGTDKDISDYNATKNIPDFHKNIAPLFTKPALNGGGSCASCHNAKDKLNLSNMTGPSVLNSTYRNLIYGAHHVEESGEIIPFLYTEINPMGINDEYHPAPFLWSLILNDVLGLPNDENHTTASRNLDRDGDYGAKYSFGVRDAVRDINAIYDHSKHWSIEDTQKIITYGTNRVPLGLSDRITHTSNEILKYTGSAQKTYQALVKKCYGCHSTHNKGGIYDHDYEPSLPKKKRYRSSDLLHSGSLRLSIFQYLENKGDTVYSKYWYKSNLDWSRYHTLNSALYRIDHNDPDNSELLVYARGYYKEQNGTHSPLNDNVKTHEGYMDEGSDEYKALENWIKGVEMDDIHPKLNQPIEKIVIKEYDEPAYLPEEITWSDEDDDLSQVFIDTSTTSEHAFNDTMLTFEYTSLNSAKMQTYAILGDRGEQNLTFGVTDGLRISARQTIPLTVTSDYIVPKPKVELPKAYLFFTQRDNGMLKKIDTNGSKIDIGIIEGYNPNTWSTMYRRSDKGWLYFLSHEDYKTKIHVVSENNASVVFDITVDYSKVGEASAQKVYLIWWRPTEGVEGEEGYRAGELQGLLKSRVTNKVGDFYVGLGSGENESINNIVEPDWRNAVKDGKNTIGIYVWRRATFMTKWVNEGIDRLNVLNLVTGKSRKMTDFSFKEQSIEGVTYPAYNYWNVRAIVVAEDGAFYGFNKDLNVPATAFNFDPMLGIQQKVDIPVWLQEYINDYQDYATPFLVVEPRVE